MSDKKSKFNRTIEMSIVGNDKQSLDVKFSRSFDAKIDASKSNVRVVLTTDKGTIGFAEFSGEDFYDFICSLAEEMNR